MRVIYKYPLEITDLQIVQMRKGAEILCVQSQGGVVCLWADVDTAADRVSRYIGVVGTGNPIHGVQGKYIGTVQIAAFVWHFFDRGEAVK